MKPVDCLVAEYYTWGMSSDGWRLLKRNDVSIIQERVPPGGSEIRHVHGAARQFFFILEGEAVIAFENESVVLGRHQGIEVPAGVPHQFRNDSASDVLFLVISVPPAHDDRKNL